MAILQALLQLSVSRKAATQTVPNKSPHGARLPRHLTPESSTLRGMGHHLRFDEQLLRQIAAKNGMNITDEQIAELVKTGGAEIMGATEAGLTEKQRNELTQLAKRLHDQSGEVEG